MRERDRSMNKKAIIIIVVILIIISIIAIIYLYSIPAESRMVLMVYNETDNDVSVWINVSKDSEVIFSQILIIENSNSITLRNITNKNGIYTVSIEVNKTLFAVNDSIDVGDPYSGPVKVWIRADEVSLYQEWE
jgi:hypothetical protein